MQYARSRLTATDLQDGKFSMEQTALVVYGVLASRGGGKGGL